MPHKILAANWKENPKSEKRAVELFRSIAKTKRRKGVHVIVCPPFIYLDELAHAFKKMPASRKRGLSLGAENVFWEDNGAYTGEIGPRMLMALGAEYVIVGHSERRKWMHETDAMINQKIKLAAADGLSVILCVGESLAVRKKGLNAARTFVKNQLKNDIKNIKIEKRNAARIVIAYEPVWAIGTGREDEPDDARQMALFIKDCVAKSHGVRPRVLYGGSVNKKNLASFVRYNEIDGALVGGASLKAKEFGAMIAIAGK